MTDQPSLLTLPMPELDPTRDLLIYPEHRHEPDDTTTVRPIPLDDAAAVWRTALESASATEPSPTDQPPNGVVVISPGRAWVIAGLVDELSRRLRPGLTVGPIPSDGSLSRLAKALADDPNRRARP
jgi:hypothetical protein